MGLPSCGEWSRGEQGAEAGETSWETVGEIQVRENEAWPRTVSGGHRLEG